MDIKDIKTSRELADLLESVAKILRTLPEYELPESSRQADPVDQQQKVFGKPDKLQNQLSLADFAYRFPKMERDVAEAEIKALTVESMRQLAALLEIRVPSKATKSETVDMLLTQVFDVPTGQERIRTFHKRNMKS